MHRRYGLLILLTALVVMACAFNGFMRFQASGLPFFAYVVDAHTAVVEPIPGIPLPISLEPGDRIDLAATPLSARIAFTQTKLTAGFPLPQGRSYEFVSRRGHSLTTVPVETVNLSPVSGMRLSEWASLGFYVLLSGIALLALWRGRDRPAAGLAFWAIAFLAGIACQAVPLDGVPGLSFLLGGWVFLLLGRAGFYLMVESTVGALLTPRSRTIWRGSFALSLVVGAVRVLGGPLMFVVTGWAELLRSPYGLAITASFLVPITMLLASYRHADSVLRLRLRWMLWSGVVFAVSIYLNDTSLLGFPTTTIASSLMFVLSLTGFLYAVLRHRVVDISVVLNRALVYAATTSLVLGLFALLESLIERTTLGHDAGLLLELAVPLALGAALSTVHRRIEAVVERFFFRHQYRAEVALRRFAQECAFITQPENLFDLTVEQIARHAGAPRVALYERTAEAYVRIRQHGEPALPAQVAADDLAFVKLRVRNAELDLNGTQSALGADGYAFPLMVRGSLLGALVVDQRPGEHFAADERELLFHVAHEVGMALFVLRAQESEARAQTIQGQLQASESQARANETRAQTNEIQLNEARARESVLLNALSALGSAVSR